MRLPQLDEQAIEIQPSLIDRFSNGPPDIITDIEEGQAVSHMDRDLSKLSMLRRDGLECCGDPLHPPGRGPKSDISEFCRLREVERSRTGVTYRRR